MSSTPRQMRRVMPKVPGAFGNMKQFNCAGTREFFDSTKTHTTGKTARAAKHYQIAKANGSKYANGSKMPETKAQEVSE